MKKGLLILLCLPMIGFGQFTYVPDDNFEQALINLGYDNVLDDSVLTANINTMTNLDISYYGNIANLTGIEDFVSLTVLDCNYNQITSLDVSNNTALQILSCEFNQLTSLDVSQNTALLMLACSDNQLTGLDLSNNTALNFLYCWDNNLTSLDVRNGNNTNFSFFNAIANPNLYCIDVDDAAWSTANWTSIDAWASFSLNCNPIYQTTYVPDDNFEAYLEANNMGNGIPNDDSVLTSNIDTVSWLNVSNQNITDLTGIEDFTALFYFACGSNQLTTLDVNANTALTRLYCTDNNLTTLDVGGAIALTDLYCGSNELTSLDVSNNTALEGMHCGRNQLTNLDVSQNISLESLGCNNNQLTSLAVNYNINLFSLHSDSNSISNLMLNGANSLIYLSCNNNQLTSLDLSNNIALEVLECKSNQLTNLDISQNTLLQEFNCDNNNLLCLDISNNHNLDYLYCKYNLLEQLNTKNGNWQNLYVNALDNNLMCAEVDNIGTATNDWDFDSFTTITTNCNYTNPCVTVSAIQEHSTNKELLKITDLLGRETKQTNQPLFYIYNDGTVEKRIVIE